jgi:hypothetical protein
MYKPTSISRTPREHFMGAVDDELFKLERKERAFRQADQAERAAKLRLPLVLRANHPLRATRGCGLQTDDVRTLRRLPMGL